MSSEALTGVVWGVGLCSANFLLSYLTARWAFRKSLQLFLRSVLGGMVVRLLATSATAGYLLAVEKVYPLGFALSFSVGVAVLLTAEIVDFHRRYETFRLRPLTIP